MSLRSAIVGQFRQPRGAVGRLAGWIMATRPSNRARNLLTLDLLGIQPQDRMLEIGCGPGFALQQASERASRGCVVGLDHARTMLAMAKSRNAQAIAEGRVQLVHGSLEHPPPLGETFDKIFSVNVIQFLADKPAVFAALFDLTTPGGVVATTYMPRGTAASQSDAVQMGRQLAEIMSRIGFEGVRCEVLELRPVPAVCVLGCRPV